MSEHRDANRSSPDHEGRLDGGQGPARVHRDPDGEPAIADGLGAEGDTATGATGSTTGGGASQVGAGRGGERP